MKPAKPSTPQGMLAGTTCLVTGGAGFVGSHIVELLLDAGAAEVRVIDNMVRGRRDNLARALASNRVRLIEGDIRDTATMKSLVAGCDTVFHQAALRITQCAQEPRAAFEVMVAATYDLVELCLAANIRKLVAASTASVYGMADQFPTTEAQHPYNNRTLYGAAKAFNEGLLPLLQRHARRWTTSRCATSTSMARAWTSTAATPRCWCVGWNASRAASRRSSSATACRPWT